MAGKLVLNISRIVGELGSITTNNKNSFGVSPPPPKKKPK